MRWLEAGRMCKRLGYGCGLMAKVIVIAIALAVISHADSGETNAATVTVNVGDFWFCDSSFSGGVCPTSIRTGDTVTWSWVGSALHSSTACSDANFNNCGVAQGWDSGIKSSGTFSRTFNTGGTFFYRCEVHTGAMRGRIEVIQDSDGDGWSDAAESIIGTNPLLKCGMDAWPVDFNNDGSVTGFDLSAVAGVIGQNVPPAPARRPASKLRFD
jgi:plastocyanin